MREKKRKKCALCGAMYSRPAPLSDHCWDCARRATATARAPTLDATISDALPPPGDARRYPCPRCQRVYFQPLSAEVCWECEAEDRAAASARIGRRRQSGIGARHAKLLSWNDLHGTDKYRQTVGIIRNFAESGDGILAVLGCRGRGKTQVCATACWQTIEAGRAARCVTLLSLIADLKGRYSDGGDGDHAWLEEWGRPHLLVIDELAERFGTNHEQVSLTSLCDRRYTACRPTILVGNLDSAEFAGCVGDSIADRAREAAGGVVMFDGWPSFRTSGENAVKRGG